MRPIRLACAVLSAGLAVSCSGPADRNDAGYVVVYTALDRMYSEPIFQMFTDETGVEVRPVYDTEATKTVGLVARLIAEADAPRCDVFWNNEVVRTIVLKRRGLLQPYVSPQAAGIPRSFKDPDGYWTGFAGRARVLIFNRSLIADAASIPRSIWALADGRFRGRAAIAKPLFGTTSTHAAFLFSTWGSEEAARYFTALRDSDVVVAAGNATVRDMAAAGRIAIGLTDTDDANGAIEDGYDVGIVLPDSETDKTLVIPNTVALMKGAPHGENGRRLIDFLLSPRVERTLSASRSAQIPLRPGVEAGGKIPALDDIAAATVDWEKVADSLADSTAYIDNEFLRP